jgi:DNA modification methylase
LICTSPPYYALRSYTDGGEHYAGQVGSEDSWGEYLASLLECTREWARVLKPGGSIFVVLGDKYSGAQQQSHGCQPAETSSAYWQRTDPRRSGIPAKSLMLLPERYRIACADGLGLIARAVIEWSKPNGLPESTADRVRRSHEDIVHFTKEPRYFSAVDEVREPHLPQSVARAGRRRLAPDLSQAGVGSPNTLNPSDCCHPAGRLPGSVWEIATSPFRPPAELGVDHHAAFPPELARRIILGWSPAGVCTACGEGRRPVSARTGETGRHPGGGGTYRAMRAPGGKDTHLADAALRPRVITGYACACPDASAPTRPGVVLDPFGGTGTTALAASVLGRTGVSVDLSADYCRLAQWRTSDPGERARALGVRKPPPVPAGQLSLFDGPEAT